MVAFHRNGTHSNTNTPGAHADVRIFRQRHRAVCDSWNPNIDELMDEAWKKKPKQVVWHVAAYNDTHT